MHMLPLAFATIAVAMWLGWEVGGGIGLVIGLLISGAWFLGLTLVSLDDEENTPTPTPPQAEEE